MNKNFTVKTSPKWLVWSILTVVIFLVGAIVMAFSGLHNVQESRIGTTLTVSIPMAETFYEDEQANIEDACEKVFANAGLKVIDSYTGEIGTMSHELVYVFESGADVSAIAEALETAFETYETKYGCVITTAVNTQQILAYLPGGIVAFALRDALAAVVFAALAFAYVSLRFKLWNGILAVVAMAASAMITVGLTAVTFVPSTGSTVYTVYLAMLIAAVLSVIFSAENRKAEKDGADLTTPEALADVIPVCETIKLSVAMLAMAVVVGVIGLIAATNFAWFAIGMVFTTIATAFISVILVPSLFIVIRKIFAKKEAEMARYDYKKGKKSKAEAPATEEAN